MFYFQYFGKLLFWTFMSSVPDVPTDTVIGRTMDSKVEMVDNIKEIVETDGWWD